ncbi:hypothetical protein BD779DRAFT_1530933 [Infundibulicybe gibba]|nr:hypothetical protein BD779DRAFT_1530933 [Infundibulicybe gibba]
MTGLLSLANELILKISDQLEKRKAFRSTCRRIDLLVSPRLFSHMTIDIWEENASSGIYQLEALATGSTRVGEYVRTLDIRRLLANPSPRDRQRGQWGRDKKWAEEKMREFLPVALSALGGVTTVIYKMETKNLEWATILVCEYLATLPMLHTLDLRALHIPPELHPSRISNLNKLVLESDNNLSAIVEIIGGSPNLTELDYHCSGLSRSGVVPSLHHLLSKVPRERPLHLQKLGASGYYYAMLHSEDLPHFRHLKSLELGHGFLSTPWPDGHDRVISSPGDIWTAVTQETPVEAVFAPPDGAVLGYLAVATGIKRIGIFGATSDVSSHNFFTNILPRHSKTLVSLSIAAGPGPWCFGTRGIDALLDCTQLTKLSITIDDTDTTKEQKERLQDTMHHIMKVTTVLPNLYCLRLFPALRGASIALKLQSCRLRKVAHRETSDALHALIVLYPMLNPTIFPRVVKLGGKKYLPQRCSDGATRYAVQD